MPQATDSLCLAASPLAAFSVEGTLGARPHMIAVLGVPAQARGAIWRGDPSPATRAPPGHRMPAEGTVMGTPGQGRVEGRLAALPIPSCLRPRQENCFAR